MKSKRTKIVFRVMLLLFIVTNISSQTTSRVDNINCDSLENRKESMLDVVYDEVPSLLMSFAALQNEFNEKVDTNLFINSIFIRVYIDTLGYTNCPKVLKGNGNIADTIAINIISSLKFSPAVIRGKKIPMFVTVPLYCHKVNETSTLIKKDGKWFDKKAK